MKRFIRVLLRLVFLPIVVAFFTTMCVCFSISLFWDWLNDNHYMVSVKKECLSDLYEDCFKGFFS